MTRREELQLCAVRIAKECIKLGMYPLANEIEQALLQVEREVWDRALENIADMRAAEWIKKQKEAL